MSLADLDGTPSARVVPKAQLRNAAQLQGARHARAEEAARLLEAFLDRGRIVVERRAY